MIARGTVGYAMVLLGGLVVSPLPESGPVVGWPVLAALRSEMSGRMLGLAIVVVGLGLATSSWLRLVRHLAGPTRAADEPARLTLVRRATWCWAAPLLPAPALFSRDAWSYAAQGELTRLDLSPYTWTPSVLTGPIVEAVDPRWVDSLTPYGPVPLLWGSLAARLTGDPWLLVMAHRGLALVGLALLLWSVPRIARWAARDAAHATALAVPSPLVLAHGVGGAHNDLVMVGLMAVALVLAAQRFWVAAAVAGGVAAGVKLPAGLVCVGVALISLGVSATRRRRLSRLTAVAAIAVTALLLTGVVAGVGAGWVRALTVPGEVRTPLSLSTQLGALAGLVLHPLPAAPPAEALVAVMRTLGVVGALALAVRVALRAPTGVPAAGVRAAALILFGVVVLGPVVHPWYLLWCLPLLAACHLDRRAAAALVHVSWFAGLAAPLDSSLAGAGAVVAVGIGLVAATAALQVHTHRTAQELGLRSRSGSGVEEELVGRGGAVRPISAAAVPRQGARAVPAWRRRPGPS